MRLSRRPLTESAPLPPPRFRSNAPLAPADSVTLEPELSADFVTLVATDPSGVVRVKIHVGRADAPWWIKVARFFLALRYGAAHLRLESNA